jgi:hypothetical protein
MTTSTHASTRLALLSGIGKYRTARQSAMRAVDTATTNTVVKRERGIKRERSSSPDEQAGGACFKCGALDHKSFACPRRTTGSGKTKKKKVKKERDSAGSGFQPRPRHDEGRRLRKKDRR